MRLLRQLFDQNAEWARRTEAQDPGFFARLTNQQTPQFFWIGCSDSRVPAEQITGLMPGDLFVHRNVANLVEHADMSAMAALQYAVEVLKVKHVLIVGHYGCGGVRAALQDQEIFGPAGEWLRPVKDLYRSREDFFAAWPDPQARWDKLCELNVIAQVDALCKFPLIRKAWENGQELAVHGWIYSVSDGCLRDMNVTITSAKECG